MAMKSHYYLAQSLLPQRHTAEALVQAKYAYSLCLENKDSSAELISQFILRAKQAAWQGRETARLREMNETLALVEDLLHQQLKRDIQSIDERYERGEIGETGRNEERAELENEAELRITNIRKGFQDPNVPESVERVSITFCEARPVTWIRNGTLCADICVQVVPDWLVDPITFEIMHDPIVTPTGVSYERVSLLKHIKASGCDPITRAPIRADQLIPNVALKNAASEFLDNNGWAVDW